MATTDYGVNHPMAVKLYSAKISYEALKKTWMWKFTGMGNAENMYNSVVYIKDETQKGPGDRITCDLRLQLSGAGVEGDGTLEGAEEALQDYTDNLLINQLRHAVRSGGKMSEQRVPFSVREGARYGLQDWFADRIDTAFFNQIAGNTGQADTRYTGHNATVAFDANHVIYPDSDVSEADVASSGASSVFTLDLIDHAVEKAQTLDIPIRPIKINGEDKYVLFLHPYQITSLRTNTNTGQWLDIQKAAMQGGKISDNPIYTGAHGEYNGTIIHASTRVPAVTTNVRRAIFCGAQSAVMAFGRDYGPNRMSWVEELFDYQNQLGVSAGLIWGLKKSRYNSEDYGTIVIPTYATAAT